MITHSYIVSVLESYAVAARQVRHLARILPDNWELIFIDDGSVPEIRIPEETPRHFRLVRTHDLRPWTQLLARNNAAKIAQGECLLMTDIDHVFTRESIEVADRFQGAMLHFRRQCGLLMENLSIWPLKERCEEKPPNIFLIRKALFEHVGGYDAKWIGRYGGDMEFLAKCRRQIGPIPQDRTAPIWVIPGTHESFHGLDRLHGAVGRLRRPSPPAGD